MDLAGAIAAEEWPTALHAALDRWRATRDPLVARLIDRIAVRITPLQAPSGDALHAWWMQHARSYDPVVATTLLGHIFVRSRGRDVAWSDVAARWPDAGIVALIDEDVSSNATNWLERMAAIETWPDDPRLASVLAHWLTGPVRHVVYTARAGVAQWIGDRLEGLADLRILPRLEAFRAHVTLGEERPVVDALVQALGRVRPRGAGVEPLLAILDEPTRLEQLWRRAARDGDARGVLADALVAIGESRGMYIALARAGEQRAEKAARLLAKEWERWLGPDLALIAMHRGTEFRGGMLEILRAGHNFTPPWAWAAVADHHELRSVHTVRPGTIVDRAERDYARFLSGLEQLNSVEQVTEATLIELAAIGARLPVTYMTLSRWSVSIDETPSDVWRLVELARSVAPRLRQLVIPRQLATDELVAAYPDLVTVSS